MHNSTKSRVHSSGYWKREDEHSHTHSQFNHIKSFHKEQCSLKFNGHYSSSHFSSPLDFKWTLIESAWLLILISFWDAWNWNWNISSKCDEHISWISIDTFARRYNPRIILWSLDFWHTSRIEYKILSLFAAMMRQDLNWFLSWRWHSI